jgi:uncharacterized protein DUF6062
MKLAETPYVSRLIASTVPTDRRAVEAILLSARGNNVNQPQSYFDLRDALHQNGCPLCRLVLASVAHYIDAVNYEFVGDPALRDQLRKSAGFCNEHGHQWLRKAHVLGTAQIYTDVLQRIATEIPNLESRASGMFSGLATLFAPRPESQSGGDDVDVARTSAPCPVCARREHVERLLITRLAKSLTDPSFAQVYRESSGLCLPHLRRVLGVCDEAAFGVLRDKAQTDARALLAQMGEIIRKHDYRYSDEPAGAERGAAERAVNFVTAEPGIVT